MDIFLWDYTILPLEQLRIIVAILGVSVGAYFDLFNNKNVPEIFLYSFLAIAFIVNLIAFDSTLSFYAIATAMFVFGAFYLLYKAGQIGGADVYIMASIALLLPVQPHISPFLSQSFLVQIPFMLNVILVSGLSLMVYMLIRSIPVALSSAKSKLKIDNNSLFGCIAIVFAFATFCVISSNLGVVPPIYLILVASLAVFSIYFTLFKDAINSTMIEWVDYHGVEPEDIIAVEKMDKKLVKEYSLSRLVDQAMYTRMKKISGKKIAVYKHLPPFVPHILIGLIFSILFGNVVLFFGGF